MIESTFTRYPLMITQSYHGPQGDAAMDFQPQDLVAGGDGWEVRNVHYGYETTWFDVQVSPDTFLEWAHVIPVRSGKFAKGEVYGRAYTGVYNYGDLKGQPFPAHLHGAANVNGEWVPILSITNPTFDLIAPDFTPEEQAEWCNWSKYQPNYNMFKQQFYDWSQSNPYLPDNRKEAIKNALNAADEGAALWHIDEQFRGDKAEIERLKNETKPQEVPDESAYMELIEAKNEQIEALEAKVRELKKQLTNATPNVVDEEVLAEKTATRTLEKFKKEFLNEANSLVEQVKTNLPRWKRTVFDSLQQILTSVGIFLSLFGFAEGSILQGDLSAPETWVSIIGLATTALGLKQIDDKNKRKIAEELAKLNQ